MYTKKELPEEFLNKVVSVHKYKGVVFIDSVGISG